MKLSKNLVFSAVLVLVLSLDLVVGSGMAREDHRHSHRQQCNHGHQGDGHHHHHQNQHTHYHGKALTEMKLSEEWAEEEDLRLCGFGRCQDDEHDHDAHLSGLGLWLHALGCSLVVSLASLVCLIILPVMLMQGRPSKAIVDALALFGAGAMLGDAFLHQLPHAFGDGHSHSHDQHMDHDHHEQSHAPAHSLKDLSVGMSVLAGIVLFLLVEKLVRYVEENTTGSDAWGHSHHHHHKSSKKLKDDSSHKKIVSDGSLDENCPVPDATSLRKRKSSGAIKDSDKRVADTQGGKKELAQTQSNLVFGYLNLFSDGVHNFTDGMALGSAFLLYGSVGGWSRTLFLLAHELPQEIGDFGILVRSGFTVSKALFFNFLSALVALAGTTMALVLGKDPGQSSLIEGFTAGGFIYIAIAGVLGEMNNSIGSTTLKNTGMQLTSLVLGMGVALCISLVE